MSLVERALQKMQAGDRARKPGGEQPPKPVGRMVRESPASLQVTQPPPMPIDPNRMVRVDMEGLRAAGLLSPQQQEQQLADQYRSIKRPLLRTAFKAEPKPGQPPAQLIMIASALPGDGKTFTAVNLALSMSREKDHTVLLVDGDVIKPHVSKLFGIDKEPGLLDILDDPRMDVRSVILPTDVPGLSLLPAGTASDTATELLASGRMSEIAAQLAALNPSGVVLFDSLPILLTSESRVLTSLAGQIVLVVKAGVTPQHAVEAALESIGPDKNVSLVLNQADLAGPLGHYYGYGYGYRAREDVASASSAGSASS